MIKQLLLSAGIALSFPAFSQFSGNALAFDGTDDMVVCNTVPAIFASPATNDFTVEAWVYPSGNAFQRIFYAQASTTNFCTFGTGNGNVIYFYVIENGATYSVATTTSLTQNQWTHVAVRWTTSSNSVEVFFNGVLQPGVAGGSSSTGTSSMMVLGSRPGGAQYFYGRIDELRVWSEARSNCEIANNYEKSLSGPETNLVVDYNFNQGVGGGTNIGITNLPDISGSGFNGTLTNFLLMGPASNWVSSTATLTSTGASVSGYAVTQNVAVCSGSSYTFPDGTVASNITAPTTHVSTLPGGCDTIITTTVNVNPLYSLGDTVSVCSGDSYTFPDGSTATNITGNLTHPSVLSSINGCDSIITTVVNVRQTSSSVENYSVCPSDSVTFPDGSGMIITAPTSHISTLVNAAGCDSVITTNISVNQNYNYSETFIVCSGSNYTFPDGTVLNGITSAVNHTSNLSTVNNCDSIITTYLLINQVDTAVSVVNETLTSSATGVTYQWIDCNNGNQIIPGATGQSYTATTNGSYAVIIDDNGCIDTSSCYLILSTGSASNIVLNIRVYPNPTDGTLNITLSASETFLTEIISVQGELIRSTQQTGHQAQINVTDLSAGLYLLRITQGENIYLQQFQKQ